MASAFSPKWVCFHQTFSFPKRFYYFECNTTSDRLIRSYVAFKGISLKNPNKQDQERSKEWSVNTGNCLNYVELDLADRAQ